MNWSILRLTLTLTGFALVTACSEAGEQTAIGSFKSLPKDFSAEEKRAARLLSIEGNLSSYAGHPRIEAMTCVLGMEYLEEQMLRAGLLSEEQEAALEQAKSNYRARAAVNLSAEDAETLVRDSEAAITSPSDKVRRGLKCLRDLS